MQGKVIVVTGAFGVLGRAVSEAARAAGATVAAIDRAPGGADPLAFGDVDLADPAAAERVMSAIHARAGRIDALLNIAGGFAWAKIAESEAALWDKMFTLNLKTALNASKAALPHLLESRGAIVNVGAASALKAGLGMGAYAASKEGVHKLTQSLAEELKGQVRVNAALPSIIDTEQNRRDMPDADFSAWVKPAELAKAMLFLASDDASAITGALLPVTGRV